MNLSLDCSITIKDHEQEFEKFYFIAMVSFGFVLPIRVLITKCISVVSRSLLLTITTTTDRLKWPSLCPVAVRPTDQSLIGDGPVITNFALQPQINSLYSVQVQLEIFKLRAIFMA